MRLADLPEVKAAIAERDRLRAELEKVKVNDALRCDVRDLIESASGEPVFPPLMDAVMSVVRPLRAAVDAALALHQPRAHPSSLIDYEYCSCRAHEIRTDAAGKRSIRPTAYPCATVRALAPVADPDPHTTSDEETT
jgi:hypothetical protein